MKHIVTFRLGDLVLLKAYHRSDVIQGKIYKFFELYEGSYKIKERVREYTYLLEDCMDGNKICRIFNVRLIKHIL